jgi:hypothetical protein
MNPSVINDRLLVMWEMQRELNKRVGVDCDNLPSRANTFAELNDVEAARVRWCLQFSRCLGQENAEFVDSLPWKHWKAQKADFQNAKVEVVDMFHFLMSMAQVLGMSAEDFYQGYLAKNKVNHNRQNGDYATNPNAVGGESDCKHILQDGEPVEQLPLPLTP